MIRVCPHLRGGTDQGYLPVPGEDDAYDRAHPHRFNPYYDAFLKGGATTEHFGFEKDSIPKTSPAYLYCHHHGRKGKERWTKEPVPIRRRISEIFANYFAKNISERELTDYWTSTPYRWVLCVFVDPLLSLSDFSIPAFSGTVADCWVLQEMEEG